MKKTVRGRKNPSSQGSDISLDDAIRAVKDVISAAKKQRIACAIAGGLAMNLYGFVRQTKDVDVLVGGDISDLKGVFTGPISFGGKKYVISPKGRRTKIPIDCIRRADDARELYEAALADARVQSYSLGLPIVSPAWMTIIKAQAGRGKDEIDLLWLLRQPGLVDRDEVRSLVKRVFGKAAFWVVSDMESWFLQADYFKARDERGK